MVSPALIFVLYTATALYRLTALWPNNFALFSHSHYLTETIPLLYWVFTSELKKPTTLIRLFCFNTEFWVLMQNLNKINGKKQNLVHWTCMDVVIQNFSCLRWPANVKTDCTSSLRCCYSYLLHTQIHECMHL